MAISELTELEKAVLTYGFFHGLNLHKLHKLAHPNSRAKTPSITSEWVTSSKVKNYIQELEQVARVKMGRSIDLKGDGNSGNNGGGNLFGSDMVDFTDMGAFIAYLNGRANTITDEGQRQKYLSMLSDLLRFKESGKDSNGDIQRFYFPISCKGCQLYKDKQKE